MANKKCISSKCIYTENCIFPANPIGVCKYIVSPVPFWPEFFSSDGVYIEYVDEEGRSRFDNKGHN